MWPPRRPPPTKPSRSDRQRPGETAAGERKRGRRYGADVPTLTGPDLVLTSGAQVAPTCGAVDGGPRRASGARASAAVGAMAFLVPTKPVQPLTPPRRGASPRICTHPPPPRNPPLQGRRAATAADPSFPRRRESTGRGGVPPPTWPSRQRPGIQGGGAGCPPLCAPTRRHPATLPYKAVAPATHQHTPTTASQRRLVNRKINPPFSRRTRFKSRRKK